MGAFDHYYERYESSLPGIRADRPPATFGESFEANFGMVTRQAETYMTNKANQRRAREILDVTGNPDYYIRAVGSPSDPDTLKLLKDLNRLYPDRVKTDAQLFEETKAEYSRFKQDAETTLQHQTTGGYVGGFLGGAAGAFATDPTLWFALPMGVSFASGILRRSLAEAGLNMVAESASIVGSRSWRKRLDDEIKTDEVAWRLGIAGTVGLGVGAGAGLLRRLRERRTTLPHIRPIDAPTVKTPPEIRLSTELTEGQRIVGGRPDIDEPITVDELSRLLGRQLDIAEHVRRDPESLRALNADLDALSLQSDVGGNPTLRAPQQTAIFGDSLETNTRRVIEQDKDLMLLERRVKNAQEELGRLPKNATLKKEALENEIAGLESERVGMAELLEQTRKIFRDDFGNLSQLERDAANVLDDWAELLEKNPFNDADSFEPHVRAIGKAEADINAGKPVDVKDIVDGPKARDDGTERPLKIRSDIEQGENPTPYEVLSAKKENPSLEPERIPEQPLTTKAEEALSKEMDDFYRSAEADLDSLLKERPDFEVEIEGHKGKVRDILDQLNLDELEAVRACMLRTKT